MISIKPNTRTSGNRSHVLDDDKQIVGDILTADSGAVVFVARSPHYQFTCDDLIDIANFVSKSNKKFNDNLTQELLAHYKIGKK